MATNYCLVVQVDRDSGDQHAAYIGDDLTSEAITRAKDRALDLALPDDGADLRYAVVESDDVGWARFHTGPFHRDIGTALKHRAPSVRR